MFVGAINEGIKRYIGTLGPVLEGKTAVVGCSGNFTLEAVLAVAGKQSAVFSNDVSLYSCLAGASLTGAGFPLTLTDPLYEWLQPYLDTTSRKLASVMLLLDMLQFERQRNRYEVRYWNLYRDNFPDLIAKTLEKISRVEARIDRFTAGDVFDHFRANDQPGSVFMCYAPPAKGSYERQYKRLSELFAWEAPTYTLLDEAGRDRLLAWMGGRPYLWIDDRQLPGMTPALVQVLGRKKPLYLYTNLRTQPAYLIDRVKKGLPKIPLATKDLVITEDSTITLDRILTSDLARYKNCYLGKNINFSSGMFAFAVMIDGVAVGFLEFNKAKFGHNSVYINSDFAVDHTAYPRLSKLVVMLTCCGETRRTLEKLLVSRLTDVCTTAFTERPVSMKYRGILDLVKRGQDATGAKFLNYEKVFNQLTWKDTLLLWLQKNGSRNS